MDDLDSLSTTSVADHEIVVFYDVDGLNPETGPTVAVSGMSHTSAAMPLKAAELATGDVGYFPADQFAALRGRYGKETVWKRITDRGVGSDFHEHIAGMLRGVRPDLVTYWKLADPFRRLLERADLYEEAVAKDERTRKSLALNLSKAASRRLSAFSVESAELKIVLNDLTVAAFATGYGFCVARLALNRVDGKPLTAVELLEAQNSLARFNEMNWNEAGATSKGGGRNFSLGELVRGMVFGSSAKTNRVGRVHTYTYVRFDEPLSVTARDAFALRLARQFTTDYNLAAPNSGGEIIGNFQTVRHRVEAEGAATIVGRVSAEDPIPKFVEDFKTTTFGPNYLPIALLALHEHAFLVGATSASLIPADEMQDEKATLSRLEDLRESALAFRLCFRFSELSYLSAHNRVNRAFRSALRLDAIMQELGGDIAEVDAYLKSARDRHSKKQFDRLTLGIAVLAAAAAAFPIGKDVSEAWLAEKPGWPAIIGLEFALFVAVVAVYLIGRGQHEDEDGLAARSPTGRSISSIFKAMLARVSGR